jgi:glycosyltransferase involved in cell wall biosynthesis
MARAQPVVAFDTPVHREYLGELGIYAPPGDVAGFAAALSALLSDGERRRCLGEKLRQRAQEQFSWRQAGERIQALYWQLTGAGTSRIL